MGPAADTPGMPKSLGDRIRIATRAFASHEGPARCLPAAPGTWRDGSMHPDSMLLVTLDSCRYDSFESVRPPALSAIGPLACAQAPSHFTFGSHCAIFAGFTPGDGARHEPFVNPKFGKIVRVLGGPAKSKGNDVIVLNGETIVDGFNREGFLTAGTGAAGWFDDRRESARHLVQHFQHYLYAGNCWSLAKQLDFLEQTIAGATGPVFAFINVGETHVPYWYQGAPWERDRNPCVPFSTRNDAAESRRRQHACLSWVDAQIAPLVGAFSRATTIVCGDHGDAWGEDGFWEHGIMHPKVLEVPLLYRIAPHRLEGLASRAVAHAAAPATPD